MHPLQGEAGAPGAHLRRLIPAVPLALAALAACSADPLASTDTGDPGDATRPSDRGEDPGRDAEGACTEDVYGPGYPDLPAASLGPGEYPALVLCPGRPDVFTLDVAPGRLVELTWATPSGVPLTVEVARRGVVLAREGPASVGRLPLRSLVGGETLTVAVGDAGAATGYALRIASADAGCEAPPGAPSWGEVTLDCLSGRATLADEVLERGDVITRCVELFGSGQVLLTGRCGDDAPLTLGRQEGRGTTCRTLGPFPEVRSDCRFELTSPSRAPLATAPGAGDGARAALSGDDQRWQGSLSLTPAGTLDPPVDPAWQGEVRTRLSDGRVTGAHPIDAAAPAFDLIGFAAEGESAELALAATTVVGELDIVVSPGRPGAEAWTLPLATARGDVARETPWTLEEAEVPELAAAHVVATVAAGLERLGEAVRSARRAEAVPLVHVRWSPGRAEACGTCFMPGDVPVIELSGRPGDPDAWDDAVILHELGHWAATAYGRDDSPGGPHDGSRVAGAIAWSEGFADFFAAWQLGGPMLIDRRADGPRVRDLEALSESDPLARGTSDGTVDGLLSERFVGAFLWDLADGVEANAPGPADEDTAVPAARLIERAFAGAREWRTDRGPPGFDLVDFLDALSCEDEQVGERAGELARSRGFPYEAPSAGDCPQL